MKRLLPVLALVAASAIAGKFAFIAFKVVVLW